MNNDEKHFQTKLALLEKHSTDHYNLRKKIHGNTEKYVTLIFAFLTFMSSNLYDNKFESARLKIMLTCIVAVIYILMIYMIIRDNEYSFFHKDIISKLNEDLGITKKGTLIPNIQLCPSDFTKKKKKITGWILHISTITLMTAIFIVVLWL